MVPGNVPGAPSFSSNQGISPENVLSFLRYFHITFNSPNMLQTQTFPQISLHSPILPCLSFFSSFCSDKIAEAGLQKSQPKMAEMGAIASTPHYCSLTKILYKRLRSTRLATHPLCAKESSQTLMTVPATKRALNNALSLDAHGTPRGVCTQARLPPSHSHDVLMLHYKDQAPSPRCRYGPR
jgi:hypothetical protein